MSQSTRDNSKRRPGQTGTLVGVRFQPDQLTQLDAWIAEQAPTQTRPEAIRQLLKAGLASEQEVDEGKPAVKLQQVYFKE